LAAIFCPQCGTESSEGQHYCRSCGTNLKVIGKVVTWSDVISKEGVPPRVKEKIAHVTEEVSRAMSKVNSEMARNSVQRRSKLRGRREKTPEERRERHLTRGFIKLGWGGGLSIFLYSVFHAIQLQLPGDVVAAVPFAIDPVVRVLWTIGLIPMLSGFGHIIAGFTIRTKGTAELNTIDAMPLKIDSTEPLKLDPDLTVASVRQTPPSITDRTTNILDRAPVAAETNVK
jgi:uncharacterized Zn finger protein (UPF0148 family)